jgi:hypothetical protein
VRIVSPYSTFQLGWINLLALRPLDKISRAVRRIGTPSLEHADVDGFVDICVASIFSHIGLSADDAVKRRRNPSVQSITKRLVGVGNRCGHGISIQIDFRPKRKALRFRLLHHPAQRCLSKKIGLVASSHIRMSTDKPSLLDAGERTRLGDHRIRIFRAPNVPERWSKVVAVLVDGKGVIAVQDMDAQSGLQIIERRTANARNIPRRQTDGTDGILDADDLYFRGLGVFKQPPFLLCQLAGVSGRFNVLQRPDTFLVSLLVAFKQFGHANG